LQQQEQLVEYAKQNAITEYDFYVDNGFSGTTLNRQALKQIFLDSTTGVLGQVIVTASHVVSRNNEQYLEIMQELEKNKISFFALVTIKEARLDSLYMYPIPQHLLLLAM